MTTYVYLNSVQPQYQLVITPGTTIGSLKQQLSVFPGHNIRLFLGNGVEIAPVVFTTNTYDNITFQQHEQVLEGSKLYLIPVVQQQLPPGGGGMNLDQSLRQFKDHLDNLLKDPATLERFKQLGQYENLGCFCDPKAGCHVDVIRNKLQELGVKVPARQAVKVKFLRPKGCDNLEEWLNNPKNCLCTRRG